MSGTAPSPGFAELLARTDRPLLLPGVGTPLEALAAAAAGFEAVYVSGYATAGWQAGKPDIGLTGLREVIDVTTAIRGRLHAPILVDADTGYGDVSNVTDTVRRLELAGAAGVQLEDQTWPKRCGHLDGKTVEPLDVMVRKLRAALAGGGRVLLRPSGTEALVRVMVEAPTAALADQVAARLAAVVAG